MHRVVRPTFCLLGSLALGGCFAEATSATDDDDANADSSGSETDSDTQGTADPSAGSDSEGGDTTQGGGDASSSGGGASDYGPAVTDALDLPWPPANYADPDLPAHFLTPEVMALDNTPADNPITDDGATLGRVLFFDTALSANDTTACASCHRQDLAFTDDVALSEGFEGGLTGRNSMNTPNARWYGRGHFFWDERADTLEDQVLMPIQDATEMGLTLDQLVERVRERPYYAELFERAFGDEDVDSDRIARALAQFIRAQVSYRSRYDAGLEQAGDPMADFPGFDAQENRGKQLFFGPAACAPCHLDNGGPGGPPPMGPLGNTAIFMVDIPTNNGLDAELSADDNGVGDVTGLPQDQGRFKSPSLRNVALGAPYMHDGRFDTLAEVIEHYDNGVQAHPNLDPRLLDGDGTPRVLNLTNADKEALEAFLGTLTDLPLLEDVRFSDPHLD